MSNKRAFHIQRPLVCIALFFGLGIYIGRYWQKELLWLPFIGLGCALMLLTYLFLYKRPTVLGIGFVLLFLGMIHSFAFSHPYLPPEGTYLIEARVSGELESRAEDGRIRAILADLKMVDEQGEVFTSKSAYWTFYPSKDKILPLDGQTINMISTLYHPMGRQNPYGFDFQLYLLQKGVGVGLSGAKDLKVDLDPATTIKNPWLTARKYLSSLYDDALAGKGELIKTMLLGDSSALADEVKQNFRDAGIAHVLAVSGLHVSILTLVFLFFLSFLGIPDKLRFGLIAVFLTLYCFLLGFNAPVFRSSLMSLIILSGALCHQRSDPLTSLAAAFILILAIRPLDLFSAGFQLSFMAVLGIFTLGDQMQALYIRSRKLKRSNSLYNKLVYAFQITLAASIFTSPIVLSVFHHFSFAGILFSPFACLSVSVLMVYGLFILPFAVIWMPLAKILAIPLTFLITLFTSITRNVANLPLASIKTSAPGMFLILTMMFMLILCTRYIKIGFKRRKVLFSSALILMILLNITPKTDNVRYILFSSGNADAAVIEDGRSTYVIDTAEHGGDLSSYLLSKGRTIDQLFISHMHRDHIGGLKQLVEQGVQIKELVLPQDALQTNSADGSIEILKFALSREIPLRYVSKGDEFGSARVSIKVLWPIKDKIYPNMNPNHYSMTLSIDLNGISLLTAGDLTGEYEHYSAQIAQVLKLSHHGAKGSTLPDYLKTVSPQLALLSANSNRLPLASAVMSRLSEQSIPMWGTHSGRAIILTVKDNGESTIEHFHERGLQ